MELLVIPTFSMMCRCGIMEFVGFTDISNNFHDFRNYGSGSRGFSKFMEIGGSVGKTNMFHGSCWFYPPFSNNFHDFHKYIVQNGVSEIAENQHFPWKLLVLPTFFQKNPRFTQIHISKRCFRNLWLADLMYSCEILCKQGR